MQDRPATGLTNEVVDLTKRPEKSIAQDNRGQTSQGSVYQATKGDAHSNPIGMINFLVQQGFIGIEKVSEEDFKALTDMYLRWFRLPNLILTKEGREQIQQDMTFYQGILAQISVIDKEGLARFIGDTVADRGSCDYFIFELYKKADQLGLHFEIDISNHDMSFLSAYEDTVDTSGELTSGTSPVTSMDNLQLLINANLIDRGEVNELVERYYKPHLKALGYSLADGELTLFTHAPVALDTEAGLDFIRALANHPMIQVQYDDSSAEAVAKTIDRINDRFSYYVQNNAVHTLFDPYEKDLDLSRSPTNASPLTREAALNNPFQTLIWNRNYKAIESSKREESHQPKNYGFNMRFVFGHDMTSEAILASHPNITCLDNYSGKEYLDKAASPILTNSGQTRFLPQLQVSYNDPKKALENTNQVIDTIKKTMQHSDTESDLFWFDSALPKLIERLDDLNQAVAENANQTYINLKVMALNRASARLSQHLNFFPPADSPKPGSVEERDAARENILGNAQIAHESLESTQKLLSLRESEPQTQESISLNRAIANLSRQLAATQKAVNNNLPVNFSNIAQKLEEIRKQLRTIQLYSAYDEANEKGKEKENPTQEQLESATAELNNLTIQLSQLLENPTQEKEKTEEDKEIEAGIKEEVLDYVTNLSREIKKINNNAQDLINYINDEVSPLLKSVPETSAELREHYEDHLNQILTKLEKPDADINALGQLAKAIHENLQAYAQSSNFTRETDTDFTHEADTDDEENVDELLDREFTDDLETSLTTLQYIDREITPLIRVIRTIEGSDASIDEEQQLDNENIGSEKLEEIKTHLANRAYYDINSIYYANHLNPTIDALYDTNVSQDIAQRIRILDEQVQEKLWQAYDIAEGRTSGNMEDILDELIQIKVALEKFQEDFTLEGKHEPEAPIPIRNEAEAAQTEKELVEEISKIENAIKTSTDSPQIQPHTEDLIRNTYRPLQESLARKVRQTRAILNTEAMPIENKGPLQNRLDNILDSINNPNFNKSVREYYNDILGQFQEYDGALKKELAVVGITQEFDEILEQGKKEIASERKANEPIDRSAKREADDILRDIFDEKAKPHPPLSKQPGVKNLKSQLGEGEPERKTRPPLFKQPSIRHLKSELGVGEKSERQAPSSESALEKFEAELKRELDQTDLRSRLLPPKPVHQGRPEESIGDALAYLDSLIVSGERPKPDEKPLVESANEREAEKPASTQTPEGDDADLIARLNALKGNEDNRPPPGGAGGGPVDDQAELEARLAALKGNQNNRRPPAGGGGDMPPRQRPENRPPIGRHRGPLGDHDEEARSRDAEYRARINALKDNPPPEGDDAFEAWARERVDDTYGEHDAPPEVVQRRVARGNAPPAGGGQQHQGGVGGGQQQQQQQQGGGQQQPQGPNLPPGQITYISNQEAKGILDAYYPPQSNIHGKLNASRLAELMPTLYTLFRNNPQFLPGAYQAEFNALTPNDLANWQRVALFRASGRNDGHGHFEDKGRGVAFSARGQALCEAHLGQGMSAQEATRLSNAIIECDSPPGTPLSLLGWALKYATTLETLRDQKNKTISLTMLPGYQQASPADKLAMKQFAMTHYNLIRQEQQFACVNLTDENGQVLIAYDTDERNRGKIGRGRALIDQRGNDPQCFANTVAEMQRHGYPVAPTQQSPFYLPAGGQQQQQQQQGGGGGGQQQQQQQGGGGGGQQQQQQQQGGGGGPPPGGGGPPPGGGGPPPGGGGPPPGGGGPPPGGGGPPPGGGPAVIPPAPQAPPVGQTYNYDFREIDRHLIAYKHLLNRFKSDAMRAEFNATTHAEIENIRKEAEDRRAALTYYRNEIANKLQKLQQANAVMRFIKGGSSEINRLIANQNKADEYIRKIDTITKLANNIAPAAGVKAPQTHIAIYGKEGKYVQNVAAANAEIHAFFNPPANAPPPPPLILKAGAGQPTEQIRAGEVLVSKYELGSTKIPGTVRAATAHHYDANSNNMVTNVYVDNLDNFKKMCKQDVTVAINFAVKLVDQKLADPNVLKNPPITFYLDGQQFPKEVLAYIAAYAKGKDVECFAEQGTWIPKLNKEDRRRLETYLTAKKSPVFSQEHKAQGINKDTMEELKRDTSPKPK